MSEVRLTKKFEIGLRRIYSYTPDHFRNFRKAAYVEAEVGAPLPMVPGERSRPDQWEARKTATGGAAGTRWRRAGPRGWAGARAPRPTTYTMHTDHRI